MVYIPEQGDLIWLDFDPSRGKEIMKRRPAFVISKKAFNEHTKMAIVAPITSTIRGIKLEVILPNETKTDGAILVFQLKSIDFTRRNAEFIEKTSDKTIEQVSSIAQLLVQ
ncbi:type II toxin-antitoxin system PemK/MazF family toxin [Legionella fairfieldensis]|uniref:type II toxin-antitoxin system PemK/MazF family toxin n=1 Tax=Legionella fairfieldensis TaxID=45064 RepID=UPI000491EBA1|nr:type II toxin-antitoxin system PemK/MazF family toxin [Legionella fairfieldensis]